MNEIQVDALNKAIEAAIYHGGDAGGAYFSAENELRRALQGFVDVMGLQGYKVSSGADEMRLIKVGEKFPCIAFESTGRCFYGENHEIDDRVMSCQSCDWKLQKKKEKPKRTKTSQITLDI